MLSISFAGSGTVGTLNSALTFVRDLECGVSEHITEMDPAHGRCRSIPALTVVQFRRYRFLLDTPAIHRFPWWVI